jgi:hypothetical protein
MGITLQVEELRREIAQIREAIRVYKASTTHALADIAQHEKRQRRLQEIVVELDTLSRRSAMQK